MPPNHAFDGEPKRCNLAVCDACDAGICGWCGHDDCPDPDHGVEPCPGETGDCIGCPSCDDAADGAQ